jgi:hypothetical protein
LQEHTEATMRVQLAWVGVVGGLSLSAACSSGPVSASLVEPGARFEMSPGTTVTVQGTDLSVRFDRVVTDSRCPADALCVTAGDAELAFTFTRPGRPAGPVALRTSSPGNRHVTGDWVFVVAELWPYPYSSRDIDPRDYRATVLVDRDAQPARP